MNLDFCPNKKSKEFQEMTSALGGEDKAYFFWMRNNGNHLEKAPNGADSKLFSTLLDYFEGNRTQAIRAKAKVYTNEFFNWFGKWIEDDKENVSKVVDENGEPLVVYHGGAPDIQVFKHSDKQSSTTGTGWYEDPITKEKIPVDSERAMFFSDNKSVALSYRDLFGIKKFQEIYAKVNLLIPYLKDKNWFWNESMDGKRFLLLFKNPNQDLISLLDELKIFNPRFERLKNYYISVIKENKKFTEKEKEAFRNLLIDVKKSLREYTENWLMGRSEWLDQFSRMKSILSEYNNEAGIDKLLNGEIPKIIKDEFDVYKLIEKNRESLGLEALMNYERVHVSASNIYYEGFVYDGNNLYIFSPGVDGQYKVEDLNKYQLKQFLDSFSIESDNAIEEIYKDEVYSRVSSKGTVYPVFLNIKNPLVHDYEGTEQGNGYKGSKKYPFGYVAARQVNKAIKEGDDGVVYENLYDPYLANNYGVFDPNQIKSATSNKQDVISGESGFSTTDDNIYHHIDKKVSGTGNLLDEIPKEGATTQQVVDNVVDFLKNKFVGLDINVYNDVSDIPQQNNDDEKSVCNSFSNKSVKSMVYHGKVYIIRSRLQKQGGQIASEEILHMLVKTLQKDNPVLFQSLLKEARTTFKKLTKEIESTYESLGQDTINNEIVTQALARFVNRDIQQNRHSKFKDLVEQFVEWLKSIVRNAAEKIGSTVYIDPTQLKNLTLQELSDLINAEDTRFDVNTSSNSSFYNMSNNSSSDIEDNINSRREEYIQKIVDNYTKDSKLKDQELQDAVMKVRDSARQQFDEQELIRIENDNTISEQDKQTIKNLLFRDLQIVRGLQQINEIPEKTADQKAFEQIKEGTKTRLRSHLSRNIKQTKLINDLKEQIASLEGVDENDVDQMFEQIKQFLLNAEQEILKTKRFINEQLINKDISTWNPQQINYIRYDLLGYYEGLFAYCIRNVQW